MDRSLLSFHVWLTAAGEAMYTPEEGIKGCIVGEAQDICSCKNIFMTVEIHSFSPVGPGNIYREGKVWEK